MNQAEGLKQFVFKRLQSRFSEVFTSQEPVVLHFKESSSTPLQTAAFTGIAEYLLVQGWRVGLLVDSETYWNILRARPDLINHPSLILRTDGENTVLVDPSATVDIVLTYQLQNTPSNQTTIYFYDVQETQPDLLVHLLIEEGLDEGLPRAYLFFVNVECAQEAFAVFRQFKQRADMAQVFFHYLGHFSNEAIKIDSVRETLIQWLVKRLSELGSSFPQPRPEDRLKALRFQERSCNL